MTKVPCYLRVLRRRWGLTQKEVASLLPRGDRNRVSCVERGEAQPNAEEILAYAVIFGFCGKAVFPRYYDQVEEVVMAHAYTLSETLKRQKTKQRNAKRKQQLITDMLTRATRKVVAAKTI